MADSTTMYRLPPIIPANMEFDLPTRMYKLPVINNFGPQEAEISKVIPFWFRKCYSFFRLCHFLKNWLLSFIGWSSSTEWFGEKTRKHLKSVGKFETWSWQIKDFTREVVRKAGKNEIPLKKRNIFKNYFL